MHNTMGSFNFGGSGSLNISEMKHQGSKKKLKSQHPSDIPHLHDAFAKARGHFNVEHMENDHGLKHGKYKNERTFGQRNQTIDTE